VDLVSSTVGAVSGDLPATAAIAGSPRQQQLTVVHPVTGADPTAPLPLSIGSGATLSGTEANGRILPVSHAIGLTKSATGLGVGLGGPTLADVLGASAASVDAREQAAGDGRTATDRSVLDIDQQGNPIIRNEVLALAPSAQAMAQAQRLNFAVLRNNPIGPLGRLVVFAAPAGLNATQALNALRRADPNGTYELNHVYRTSSQAIAPVARTGRRQASTASGGSHIAIGLVDGGVERTHSDLRAAKIISANFAGSGEGPASEHGTAIASLLVGSGVTGALPGATLYAADVYGGKPHGGAADAIIRGLVWTAERGATVINVSLVGPANAMLERTVKTLSAKGHVIVAAVGNDGPAHPVGYPAAYKDVVAVTSVDKDHKIQVDANRGPQVLFAAHGVNVRVATLDNSHSNATGTSFAAPIVAARIAAALMRPGAKSVSDITKSLEAEALDLGRAGRDPVFGYGFIEAAPPIIVAARSS
jgi:hypothetical protein